jgi:hypothetical protein
MTPTRATSPVPTWHGRIQRCVSQGLCHSILSLGSPASAVTGFRVWEQPGVLVPVGMPLFTDRAASNPTYRFAFLRSRL